MTACTGDDGGDAATDDVTATASPSPTGSPSVAPTDDQTPTPGWTATEGDSAAPSPTEGATVASADIPSLDARCTIQPSSSGVDTIEFSVPSSWQGDDQSCELLDPALAEIPDQTDAPVGIVIDVTDVAYGDMVADGPAVRDSTRWVGARANRQSVRRTATTTGEGLGPEGLPLLSWFVDLDAGTDDQGGVLSMSTGRVRGDEYALAAAVLDRIAQTVIVRPPAEGPSGDGFAVTRLEGGGTPATVTHDGDCFHLRPGGPTDDATEELCDLDPTDGQIVAGVLGDSMLVGYTGPQAVTVTTPQLSGPYGMTTPIEGSSIFAFPVDADRLPTSATARTAGGGIVAEGEVG